MINYTQIQIQKYTNANSHIYTRNVNQKDGMAQLVIGDLAGAVYD